MKIFLKCSILLAIVGLIYSCKNNNSVNDVVEIMHANVMKNKAEFQGQISCMELYAENRERSDSECSYNPVEIVEAGYVLLEEMRDKISESRPFIIIFLKRSDSEIISANVPQPIKQLNPNYVMIFNNYIRIELGGFENHYGYFICDEEYCSDKVKTSRKIIPGLYCYGE